MKKFLVFVGFFLFCSSGFSVEIFRDVIGQGTLVVDKEGNLYLDHDEHSISKYSPGGKFLFKMGRKGEGPGDIKRLGSFAINPINNVLYVTEYYQGNKWISKFSSNGKFLGEWKYRMDWSKYDAVLGIHFDNQGNTYLGAEKIHRIPHKDFILRNQEKGLLKFSADGKHVTTIYTFKSVTSAEKKGNFNPTIPFQNSLSWTVFEDKVIVKETAGNVVNVFSADGVLEKKIPFPAKREKVEKKDLDRWEKELKSVSWIKRGMAEGWVDIPYWRKRLPFPAIKPNTSWNLLTDSSGNLYVKAYEGSHFFKINLKDGQNTRVAFKPGEFLLYIMDSYFYFAKQDEDDETIILKYHEKELFEKQPGK